MARTDDSGIPRKHRKPAAANRVHSSTARDFRRSYRGRSAEEPLRLHAATRALAQILAHARNPQRISAAQLGAVGAVSALIIVILAVALLFSHPFGGAMLGPVLPSSAFAVIAILGIGAYAIINRDPSGKG